MTNDAVQTWRVVLDDGTVHEVSVKLYFDDAEAWLPDDHGARAGGATARAAVVHLASQRMWGVVEILTPGQVSRAEALLAATDLGAEAMREAAVRACVTQAKEMATTAGALGCDFCAEAIEDLPLPTAPTLAPAAGPSTCARCHEPRTRWCGGCGYCATTCCVCDAPFAAEAPHG